MTVESRIDSPVHPGVVQELLARFDDFRSAYQEGGMFVPEFDGFGATRRTLRQFSKAVDDLSALVRDTIIPSRGAKNALNQPNTSVRHSDTVLRTHIVVVVQNSINQTAAAVISAPSYTLCIETIYVQRIRRVIPPQTLESAQ